MTFDFTCPSCGEMIAVDHEHRGWTVRCPVCQSQFQAGTATLPGSRDEDIPDAVVDDEDELDALDALPFASVAVDRDLALRMVAAPSWFIEIIAWLHLLALGGFAALVVLGVLDAQQNGGLGADDEAGIVFLVLSTTFGLGYFAAMAYGARQMRSLRNYNWALASGILGILGLFACVCGVFLVVAGCWGIVVVNRPEVRRAFEIPG